ncbi:MAG: hypothetical protein AB1689_24875 [Thermodesulfobacteriota bacterium]
MRRRIEPMMRRIVTLAMLVAVGTGWAASPAWSSDDVDVVRGSVTWVSADSVEVGGRRALLTAGTSITSNGREVSLASVVVGAPAELEVDSAGRALEVRVQGAVE